MYETARPAVNTLARATSVNPALRPLRRRFRHYPCYHPAMLRLCLGFLAAAGVSAAAVRARALTPGGAAAATAVGGIIIGLGGPGPAALLLLFFATSSFLSGSETRDMISAKGKRRDARQVVANGGVPALAAALGTIPVLQPPAAAAIAGSLAAVTSDTWSSEIGRRAQSRALHVRTRRSVPAGTSGGVTPAGTLGGIAGSLIIALADARITGNARRVLPVLMGGLAGNAIDTILGATVQEVRACPSCGILTEQRVHRPCGAETSVCGGVAGFDNDLVNLGAAVGGALVAVSLAR